MPDVKISPIRKAVAQLGPIVGTSMLAYGILFVDWRLAFGVAALGLGIGWAALRPVSDAALAEWLPDPRPPVIRGILKWGTVACAAVSVAIQIGIWFR